MMPKSRSRLFLLFLPLAVAGLIVWGMASGEAASSTHHTTALAMPTPESWIILPTLPATATQADVGAQIYRLVCKACHGDRGQGLTEEWRATWNPADRNCWQSKCHAANHPPEGFDLPRSVPPVIGPGILAKYQTAQDLHAYLQARMPWYAPGTLTDEEYWQLTAYLARANGLFDEATVLTASNAASIRLAPAQSIALAQPTPSPTPAPSTKTAFPWPLLGAVLLAALAVAILILSLLRR
jgi:mono/diheme cytochrome c family protein